MHVAKAMPLSLVAHKGPADDGKRSEAEWTLHYAGIKGEWGSGERGSPVGSRTTPADLAKMVPKMNPHFTCLGGRFWGFKMV